MEKVLITGADSELRGVGRLADGRAVFVPGALAGETAEVEITKAADRWCEARLLGIETPSAARRESECPYYPTCGGCRARHMSYEETLRLKRQKVEDALARLGKVDAPVVYDTLGCADPERMRNKAEYPIVDGVIGAYIGESHRVLPIKDCLLQKESSVKLLSAELPCKKQLSFAVTRVNRKGELMLTLSAKAPLQAEIAKAMPRLRKALPELVSLSFVRLKQRPAHALDGAMTHIWGRETIDETLLGLEFTMSPQSFFQVNPEQTEILYTKAMEAAGLTEPNRSRVLDIYCGAGTISLAAARTASHVTGVELVPPAIENAKQNAVRNGMAEKTRFICGDAAKEVLRLFSKGERFDTVILDPPRKGAEEAMLRALAKTAPERIAYVSCNPATLARDVKVLSECGYRLEWAQPVDMFPWTAHVETVVLLSKVHTPKG